MRIKIESDGRAQPTRLTDADTGQPIEQIRRLELTIDVRDPFGVAKLEAEGIPTSIVSRVAEITVRTPIGDLLNHDEALVALVECLRSNAHDTLHALEREGLAIFRPIKP